MNGLPLAAQQAAYDTFVVPESRRVPAQALTKVARIDFAKDGAPLLFVAGTDDNVIPAALNRTNHARYRRKASVTELQELPRTHFVLGQAGWETVADTIGAWLTAQEL